MFASFQPSWSLALLGGILIGLGSLLAAGATGKIPGISGLFSQLLLPRSSDAVSRIAFFIGLLSGAGLTFAFVEASSDYVSSASPFAILVAGLLVGFGTRLGGGCTSGHGVCGLGLGSKSAFVATLTFMASAVAVVFVLRHSSLGVSW